MPAMFQGRWYQIILLCSLRLFYYISEVFALQIWLRYCPPTYDKGTTFASTSATRFPLARAPIIILPKNLLRHVLARSRTLRPKYHTGVITKAVNVETLQPMSFFLDECLHLASSVPSPFMGQRSRLVSINKMRLENTHDNSMRQELGMNTSEAQCEIIIRRTSRITMCEADPEDNDTSVAEGRVLDLMCKADVVSNDYLTTSLPVAFGRNMFCHLYQIWYTLSSCSSLGLSSKAARHVWSAFEVVSDIRPTHN